MRTTRGSVFPWRRTGILILLTAVIALLHFQTPVSGDRWLWLHIPFQKLFYIPILMAAAWFGVPGTFITALGVSGFFLVHILRDWDGDMVRQADQFGEIASFWVIAAFSSLLFRREKRALEETAAAHEETLSALASSLDLREHETALHSLRVREYTLMLARTLGVKGDTALRNMGTGAILHDMGKIGIPDRILLKEGELTEEERGEIQRHPELGASLIANIRSLEGAREIVRYHHEKYDGTGYPGELSGKKIPIGARIFAVADVFDALSTARPYRTSLSYREISEHITKERGEHFDPDVVDAFLAIPFRECARVASRYGVVLREK